MFQLTSQQIETIENRSDIKRVIACAGSGKTFVLTRGIIKILEEGECRPEEILAITFTRNAAENMRQKIKDELGKEIDFESINIYTFNSFGNLIISENSFLMGLGKDYKLINSTMSWQILLEIIKYGDLKRINIGKNPAKFVEQVLDYISRFKSNLIYPEDLDMYYDNRDGFLANFKSRALRNEEEEIFEYLDDISYIYKRYETIKKSNNFVDYNDHIFLPYRLLLEHKKLADKYRDRYRYIFVDEFQDTDVAQGYLISLLFKPGSNRMMVVGDDDQGIYSFRGACVENIMNFSEWDIFSSSNVRDFYLTTNFRSGKNIIKTLNSIISSNDHRFRKEFKISDTAENSEVLFFAEETHEAECAGIVRNIRALIQKGLRLKDIAILSRVKRFKTICETFDKNGLKYELISSKGFFYEPEIMFLISWLIIVRDINEEIYLLYLLQSQKYKISDRDIFFLKNYQPEYKKPSSKEKISKVHLIDGLLNHNNNPFLSSEAKKRIKRFIGDLEYYIKQNTVFKLTELISLIFKHSGLYDELRSDFDDRAKNKIRNIERMIKISADFETGITGGNIENFILYLKEIARTEDDDPEKIEFSKSNSIKIMSIHAAKGLEFKAVFLPMLWENDYAGRMQASKLKIPALLRKDSKVHRKKDNFASRKAFRKELKEIHTEEERRIFYVGCSRAKNYLFLSYSSFENMISIKKKDKRKKEPLSFLGDAFKSQSIKALNKKSQDFIKQVYGVGSGIGVYKYRDSNNSLIKKEITASSNKCKDKDLFNPENAKKAEERLVALVKDRVPVKVHKTKDWFKEPGKRIPGLDFSKGKKSFSLTEIIDYTNCPSHYKWKYFYNIPEPGSRSTKKGEKVHEDIYMLNLIKYGNLINGNFIDRESGEQKYDEILNKIENKPGNGYIKNYISSRFYSSTDIDEMFLEQLFYWNLNGNIISCKIDRMDIKKDGKIRIIDYKISGLKNEEPGKDYLMQMKAYIIGAADILGTSVENINACLFFLGNSIEYEVQFNKDQLEKLKTDILETINNINNLKFKDKTQSICNKKSCFYYKMCGI